MNYNENGQYRHKKYRLVEQFDTYSEVLDIETNTTHVCFKLDTHTIGDEFYLYEKSRGSYNIDKIFFKYSILNRYKAGQSFTFNILKEINGLILVSNCNYLTLAAPSKFKETPDQKKIDLEIENLDLELNRVMFKDKPQINFETTDNLSDFKENEDYEFELKKSYYNKKDNLVMIVGYKHKHYYLNVPSHLSQVDFKPPIIANITTSEDGTKRYLRLSRKYISESLYSVGKQYTFKIVNQIESYERGISFWVVKDENGIRNRYYPEDDLTFDNEINKLREGDKIELTVLSISDNGNIKLISDVKNWEDKNYLVEEMFETIGYADKEDEYFFKYANVLGVSDEDIDNSENSFLEQYNEGNNLWVFSYLSFLDSEIFNELEKGKFEEAKTLINIYLSIEKWMLEESDYLTNFSQFKIEGIIQKAEHKIFKLNAALTAIDIFLEGKDQEYIDDMNESLSRTPYLKNEKKEVFKQFLNISQYFRGDADFEELSNTILLLLEKNLILKEDRWVFINTITSYIYRIKKKINELLSDEVEHEKTKELKQLITYNFLLVYFYVIDGNHFKASVTSVNLLRNLSLYSNKVEYLDLAINLIIHNGYITPNIFKHKNVFDLNHNQLQDISVYNNNKEHSFQNTGNILNVDGSFIIIPKNLYCGLKSCNLKTLAKLGEFDLYVKSHFDLNLLDEKEEIDVVIENAIQTIKHKAKSSEYVPNYISYKELDISYDKVYTGKVKSIHHTGDYCYLRCVIDDFVIDTLLHIHSFHKNRLAGYLDGFIHNGDDIKFKVTKVEDERIMISPSVFVDNYADVVLKENKVHYGKVLQSNNRYSKILTTDGLAVIVSNSSYKEGDVVKLKIDEYREGDHMYSSNGHELCNEVITEDSGEIFRKYLIAIGMLTPVEEQNTLDNKVISKIKNTGHIKAENNSNELRILSSMLINTLEYRLNYITEPKEIALNYFFIITLSGVMQHPKSFEYSNKLNNLTRIVNLQYSKEIELLDTVQVEDLNSDIDNLEKLKEESNTIGLLKYLDSELIELPVSVNPTSPQYKLKKLIESINLLRSYQLGGKLTNDIKKLVVHELYNTLQVSHNSIIELESVSPDEYEIKEVEKSKRVITNLGAESKYKEFKTSIFYSASDKSQKDVIMQTICGFLNAYDGVGYLYIGVDDSGEIKGLKADLNYIENVNNLDRYQNHLQQLVVEAFPKEINTLLDYKFHKSNNLNYLEITVPAHDKPVTYKEDFFQRQGVQTRILKGQDITDFIIRKTNRNTPFTTNLTTQTITPSSTTEKDEVHYEKVKEYALNERTEDYNPHQNIDFYKDLKQPGNFQHTKYNVESDNLLGYLYILKDNNYVLSATKINNYEIEVPITERYRFGHLLFCYDNACVNKVDVRSIINKSFNTKYMNAVSNQGKLMKIIKSLPNETIGIETKRFNKIYVKLYDIDNISEHKITGLKGNCIVQEDFDEVVAYYHNETLPEDIEVFRRDSRQGYGREVTKHMHEYKLLKNISN